jgi:sulfite reductase (NADPH) flavoprotein alpha-component
MKKLWFKVHWFLGIFLGIFLILTALSGAVLSFEQEIKDYANKELYKASNIKKEPFSPSEIIQTIKSRYPRMKVMTIIDDKRASLPIVRLLRPGQKGHEAMLYSVNIKTKEIRLLKAEHMFIFMNDFHRRFLLGFIGEQGVAFLTVMLLVLGISGLYLYWGQLKRRFFKAIKIDFTKKGRAFLYQLHSAIGIWLIPWYLLISLTGLYWSYNWYEKAINSALGINFSIKHGGHEKKMSKMFKKPPPSLVSKNFIQRYDKAWDIFQIQNIRYKKAILMVLMSRKTVDIWYLDKDSYHSDAYNRLSIDTKQNKIVSLKKFKDLAPQEQFVRSMSVLHSGEFFGWIGRISVFIASIGMLLFVITGWMLYLKKKKKKAKFIEKGN